jgi:hypothetical protein
MMPQKTKMRLLQTTESKEQQEYIVIEREMLGQHPKSTQD